MKNIIKEKALIVFAHLLFVLTLYGLIETFESYLQKYGYLDYLLSLGGYRNYFFDSIAIALAIIPLTYLIFWKTKLIGWNGKISAQGWADYNQKAPMFMVCCLGLVGMVTTFPIIIMTLIHEFNKDWSFFSEAWNSNWLDSSLWFSVLYFVLAYLLGALSLVSVFLSYFAFWERVKAFFLPYFWLYVLILGMNAIAGILDFIKWKHGDFTPNSLFAFWWNQMLWKHYLAPALSLFFIWLLYRWSWFETVKVDNNPKIPKWMNGQKFWWWICGFMSMPVLYKLAEQILWLFKGSGAK